jgi:hypothetical protein
MPSRPYTTSACCGSQALQGTHLDTNQIGMEYAHQDVGRIGWVGQRAQDVERWFSHPAHGAPAPRSSWPDGDWVQT